ncbi:MAG: 2-C-methyl-D-erythritol 4-phosphate cytidylyltransferase [Deltaproteobacteria bacterium]|nr:2-C-methyl-D-erythritol 4-phosphate cytidylyltransferase [Deltaproteobacteria bacterium]
MDVILPSAGRGTRMGGETNKVLMPLEGVAVVVRAAAVFQAHPAVRFIWLVARPEDSQGLAAAFGGWLGGNLKWSKIQPPVPGGAQRQDSVAAGLRAMAGNPPEGVLIHDGARPFLSAQLVDRVIEGLAKHPAVVPRVAITDTVREITPTGSRVVNRQELFRMQTPQGFHWGVICKAYESVRNNPVDVTDDAQLVEQAGGQVAFVWGEARNIKLTRGEDMALGTWLLAHPNWGQEEPALSMGTKTSG